jgi:hypothetical protein
MARKDTRRVLYDVTAVHPKLNQVLTGVLYVSVVDSLTLNVLMGKLPETQLLFCSFG